MSDRGIIPEHERPQSEDTLSFNARNETLQQLDSTYNTARLWLQTVLTAYDHTYDVQHQERATLRGTVRLTEDRNVAGEYKTSFELFVFDDRGVQMEWTFEPRFGLLYDASITIKPGSYTYRHDDTQPPTIETVAHSRYKDDGHRSIVIENGRLWPFKAGGFSTIYVVMKGREIGIYIGLRTFFPICATQLTEFQSGGMFQFRSMDGPTVPLFTKAFKDD